MAESGKGELILRKQPPSSGSTPINSVKHRDKRAHIPTEELRKYNKGIPPKN
jgi:hypothetical protein